MTNDFHMLISVLPLVCYPSTPSMVNIHMLLCCLGLEIVYIWPLFRLGLLISSRLAGDCVPKFSNCCRSKTLGGQLWDGDKCEKSLLRPFLELTLLDRVVRSS